MPTKYSEIISKPVQFYHKIEMYYDKKAIKTVWTERTVKNTFSKFINYKSGSVAINQVQ